LARSESRPACGLLIRAPSKRNVNHGGQRWQNEVANVRSSRARRESPTLGGVPAASSRRWRARAARRPRTRSAAPRLRRRAGKGIAAIVAEHQAAPDGIQDVEWAREAPPECRLLDTCSSDAPLIQASGRGTSIAQALVLALDNVRRGVRRRLTGVYPAAAFVPRVTLVPHHGAEAG